MPFACRTRSGCADHAPRIPVAKRTTLAWDACRDRTESASATSDLEVAGVQAESARHTEKQANSKRHACMVQPALCRCCHCMCIIVLTCSHQHPHGSTAFLHDGSF